MATNKLIKPTNVTVSIPAFTDQPDQRVNSNCIDKSIDGINALSDQIGNLVKHYDYGNLAMTVGTDVYKSETIPAGYTAVGAFVNYAPSSPGVLFVKAVTQNGQTITIRLSATESTSYFYTNVIVLCVKS